MYIPLMVGSVVSQILDMIRERYPHWVVQRFTGSLSVMDSVRLFSVADIVIAPHGAANLFSMFMKRDGAYLEVHWGKKMPGEGNDWNPCHVSIASSTGSKVCLLEVRRVVWKKAS